MSHSRFVTFGSTQQCHSVSQFELSQNVLLKWPFGIGVHTSAPGNQLRFTQSTKGTF